MKIVQINAQRRFDNSGPIFAAFKKKLIDFSANPVAMKVDRLHNGDIIRPIWPIRYILFSFFTLYFLHYVYLQYYSIIYMFLKIYDI